MILPAPGLMDTIAILADLEDGVYAYESDGKGHPRDDYTLYFNRSLLRSLWCKHDGYLVQERYLRIDHRAGPGSDADNFEGVACKECGKILQERKIN